MRRISAGLPGAIIGMVMVGGFGTIAGYALADPPVAMAPPLGAILPIGTNDGELPRNTGTSSVFSLKDIMANRKVPLSRAVFDQRGYQLFGKAGETIVIPFADQNLYVMKFAPSTDDLWYFVNDNGIPTLYVPQNGYLDNATEPGAKWYPFAKNSPIETPASVEVAPIFNDPFDRNWYPNTSLYGGYYGTGQFPLTSGWTIYSNSRPYNRWNDYPRYNVVLPPLHDSYYTNRPFYSVTPLPGDSQGVSEQTGKQNAPASSPRYMGNPNFIDRRDRAPGPVYSRPTGYTRPTGSSESRPAPRGEVRNENKRPESKRTEGKRTPGGARAGGRYSKDGSRRE